MVGSKNSHEWSPSDFNVDIRYHVMGNMLPFCLEEKVFSSLPHRSCLLLTSSLGKLAKFLGSGLKFTHTDSLPPSRPRNLSYLTLQ